MRKETALSEPQTDTSNITDALFPGIDHDRLFAPATAAHPPP